MTDERLSEIALGVSIFSLVFSVIVLILTWHHPTHHYKEQTEMKSITIWKLSSEEKPCVGSNVETSEDGINTGETMDYLDSRTYMLAGVGGGNGYFGEGFATDGSTACEQGLILDEPKYWRYNDKD